jgi:hypothetical protein
MMVELIPYVKYLCGGLRNAECRRKLLPWIYLSGLEREGKQILPGNAGGFVLAWCAKGRDSNPADRAGPKSV